MDVAVVVAVVETTELNLFCKVCIFSVFCPAASFSLATQHVHCLVKVQRFVSRTTRYRLLSILRRERPFGILIWRRYNSKEDGIMAICTSFALLRCRAGPRVVRTSMRGEHQIKIKPPLRRSVRHTNVVRLQPRPRCLILRPIDA